MNEMHSPASLNEFLRSLDADGVTGYSRYAAVRRFIDFRAREQGVPVSGTFELTPLCNLDCKMCYVHLNKAQMHGAELLPTEVWKDFMQQAIDAGMIYATLTGGECLTYPGFRELYLFLQAKGIEVTVLTNGLLLDSNIVEFFKAHPPALIRISVYGADDDAYERVTGRREFTKVMENIRNLRANELPVAISVTPSAYMSDTCKIVQLLHDEGLPFIVNPGLITPREETGRTVHDASLDEYVEVLKFQRKLLNNDVLSANEAADLPDENRDGKQVFGLKCGAGRSCFSISWDGRLEPCNGFIGIDEDLLKESFREAWKKINAQANSYPLPVECSGCTYENICIHCVCMHLAGAPIGHANPKICKLSKKLVSEGLYKL